MNEKISRRAFAASGIAFLGLAGRASANDSNSSAEFAKVGEPDFYEFTMSGTERHFGRYTAFGEMHVSTGAGAAVLTAANGDQIVGVVAAAAEEDDRSKGHFHFSWRDSVVVGGQVYVNTGRFARNRPTGLVVVVIISVLIGLLFPMISGGTR